MPEFAIDCVVGARPNFIKIAPILQAFSEFPEFRPRLIHTGQHYSPEMSDSFFRDLAIQKPDVSLDVGGGSQIQQMAEIMRRLESLWNGSRPSLVLVVGDVTSTVAAAVTAAKMSIPVAHVEAGLRSFDLSMPEEINRIVTDRVSRYLFVSETSGLKNLHGEGVAEERVFFVGNVMIDTLLRFRARAQESSILRDLDVMPRDYAAVTLHRPANVDDPVRLRALIEMLNRLAESVPVVFPIHPRTRASLESQGIGIGRLRVTPPLGYLDFLRLMSDARLVLTDSGGIQEETTILGVPCLTMRENTERPATITDGTNRLVGVEPEAILQAALEVLDGRWRPSGRVPELWDGNAGTRIAAKLLRLL